MQTSFGETVLFPMFVNNNIEVLREEEAYSFEHFVADVGGVLGLFVGFNFLMILDFAVQCAEKYLSGHDVA